MQTQFTHTITVGNVTHIGHQLPNGKTIYPGDAIVVRELHGSAHCRGFANFDVHDNTGKTYLTFRDQYGNRWCPRDEDVVSVG